MKRESAVSERRRNLRAPHESSHTERSRSRRPSVLDAGDDPRAARDPRALEPDPHPEHESGMSEADLARLAKALTILPSHVSVLTAAHENTRTGIIVRWAMQCASEPVFVCIAVERGHHIAPLIRDSRSFGLCLISEDHKLAMRKFHPDADPDTDPFDSFEVRTLVTGSPLLAFSRAAFDCEVVRHFDLEANHEIYVGRVLNVYLPNT